MLRPLACSRTSSTMRSHVRPMGQRSARGGAQHGRFGFVVAVLLAQGEFRVLPRAAVAVLEVDALGHVVQADAVGELEHHVTAAREPDPLRPSPRSTWKGAVCSSAPQPGRSDGLAVRVVQSRREARRVSLAGCQGVLDRPLAVGLAFPQPGTRQRPEKNAREALPRRGRSCRRRPSRSGKRHAERRARPRSCRPPALRG